jgi:hypothetical protein
MYIKLMNNKWLIRLYINIRINLFFFFNPEQSIKIGF